MKKRLFTITVIAVIIAAGFILRAYAAFIIKPINGDSAVFALMAKHIMELKEFPIYMPQAHYAGALSSYISAALFTLFGTSYNIYIITGFVFSCAWLIAMCVLNHKILNGFGAVVSDILAAIPGSLIIIYSLYTGVHAENLVFISILLILAVNINNSADEIRPHEAGIAGLVSGLALWSMFGSIPAVLTVITFIFIKNRNRRVAASLALFAIGFIAGYMPAIIYNFQHPAATLLRMAGRVLDLDRSALSDPHLWNLISGKILWRLSTVPASLARIPHTISGLVSPPVAIILLVSVAISAISGVLKFYKDKVVDGIGVIWIYLAWFILFHIIFVGEAAARYMVPLYVAVPVLIGSAGLALAGRWGKTVPVLIIAGMVIFNTSTIASGAHAFTAGRFTELVDWMDDSGISYGYSDYDTAYVVQFLSGEKILMSPTLFHPTFADRWPEETKRVKSSPAACYIIDSERYGGATREFDNRLGGMAQPYKKYMVDGFIAYRRITHEGA